METEERYILSSTRLSSWFYHAEFYQLSLFYYWDLSRPDCRGWTRTSRQPWSFRGIACCGHRAYPAPAQMISSIFYRLSFSLSSRTSPLHSRHSWHSCQHARIHYSEHRPMLQLSPRHASEDRTYSRRSQLGCHYPNTFGARWPRFWPSRTNPHQSNHRR